MRCPGGEYMADPDADQTSQSAKDATKAAHDRDGSNLGPT